MESFFTLGFRLSRSLFMESFFTFGSHIST
jgi:hypothetical protein